MPTMRNKRSDLEPVILKLLDKSDMANLQDIAAHAGLAATNPTDRRAIQRALTQLIKRNAIQVSGRARARIYTLVKKDRALAFPLSSERSIQLLHYLSKPLHRRKPVGYNQKFLKRYRPNQTAYLSPTLQKKLLAVGKVEKHARPAGTYARTILNRLLIDLSWNSSRLEGNTYSLLETKRLIELGENAVGKDAAEAQMILNHKEAIEYIIESADEKKMSLHKVRSIHALLSENLLGDPAASGRIREIAVGISGTPYSPLENPHVINECLDIIVKKMNQIKNPFEQSFFALVHLSYIQAFEDVNKRTARLVANVPLIHANLKPLSFVDVNQNDYVTSLLGAYEKNDTSLLCDLYVWAYQRSAQRYSAIQQSMGEPNLFKLKYRKVMHEIVRTLIIKNITGHKIVEMLKKMIRAYRLSDSDANQLFQVIETEIMSLHEGNIARYKIKPSEFQKWKNKL